MDLNTGHQWFRSNRFLKNEAFENVYAASISFVQSE